MTDTDTRVLMLIQNRFPLVQRPYEAIGRQLGLSESEAFDAVTALRDSGTVRRLGATFDLSHLGYVSTLAAAAVDPDHLEDAAEFVNGFGEVTHNYQRSGTYNMWFTIIAPSRERIAQIQEAVSKQPGCTGVLNLPAEHMYKIRVEFDAAGTRAADERHGSEYRQHTITPQDVEVPSFTDEDIALIRLLQGDVDRSLEPFGSLGAQVGLSGDETIGKIEEWLACGVIRRFGAAVRHRRIGVSSNAMTVWDIPEDQVNAAGELMSTFSVVSHCYERRRCEEWPYNMYTMLHAKDDEVCRKGVQAIHEALTDAGIDVPDPHLLFSSREFKKRSMRYFMEEDR